MGANMRDVNTRIVFPNTSTKGNFPRDMGKWKTRIRFTILECTAAIFSSGFHKHKEYHGPNNWPFKPLSTLPSWTIYVIIFYFSLMIV